MKHSNSTPKHAETPPKKDLSEILKRSDEKVKDIFQRRESGRDRTNDLQRDDCDLPPIKQP
jgi:hypothetical protein